VATRKIDSSSPDTSHAAAVLTRKVSGDYAAVAAWQKELHSAIQALLIERFEPAFNAQLASMPQATREEKKELCRWANAELRSLGLAIRCPKTGHAAILHTDLGYRPEAGCFQLELTGQEHGRRRTRTFVSLIPLELMPASPRVDPLAQYWAERALSNQGSGKKSR
jgi:hypothetical protein